MAKAEKRELKAVVADLKKLVDEWATDDEIEPGSRMHAAYVQVVRKLLAESQKCEK